MSVGGTGIPRLQELTYVEVAATQVAAGATFEQIRRAVVDHAAELARDADVDGSFDQQRWNRLRTDSTQHVNNAVDVLKELMRLGFLEKHVLPSTRESAYLHADATFALTIVGESWVEQVNADRRAAYNVLVGLLGRAHPQFGGYLRLVGATPDSTNTHFTIPVLRPTAAAHPNNAAIVSACIDMAADAAASGTIGWQADRAAVEEGVRAYVDRIEARMRARKKTMTRKQLVNTCEEAVTRVAFTAAGCPLDYISMEMLRRWTRTLGIANFSYYAPGPDALRLWSTADVDLQGVATVINRRVGAQVRRDALEVLWKVWHELRGDSSTMYLPIWRVRAAVCWRQRINDEQFDIAIGEMLAGEHADLPFQIHLDQASLRTAPASTRPLVVATSSGARRVFNIINLAPASLKEIL